MKRREFCRLAGLATAAGACLPAPVAAAGKQRARAHDNSRFMLDMVHIGPGEPAPKTAFLNPNTLARLGYNGQVVLSLLEGVPNFGALSPSLVPPGSPERVWSNNVADHIQHQIDDAHAAGLHCFAWMQFLVFPISVVQAYKAEICDAQGRVDIALPTTQRLLRIQVAEVFDRFPKLDGLLIRTGEVYLQGLPYHASTSAVQQAKVQGSSAILHAEESHVTLLNILREEVCVKRSRYVFYRTWDFGDHFHNNPAYYLRVTDAIDPHPKLLFSVKHQKGDFHQLTQFNPTLTIGKHRQIVEVQCQREAYGKGAHPYYIGGGVIDGWEEMARIMKPGAARGLRDIIGHPLYGGTWTWSRGGGWEGPYISNEMWCAANVYAICKFNEDPSKSESEICAAYARSIGLRGTDVELLHEMLMLSAKGVLRGQLTNLPAAIDVWWTRDDKMGNPDLGDFLRKGLVPAAIDEKNEAHSIWLRIMQISCQIHWSDHATREFVKTSIAYGCFKYDVIGSAWKALLLGRQGDATGTYDLVSLRQAIDDYDAAWAGWKKLRQEHASCASLYKDVGFNDQPGLGAAVDKYRRLLAT